MLLEFYSKESFFDIFYMKENFSMRLKLSND